MCVCVLAPSLLLLLLLLLLVLLAAAAMNEDWRLGLSWPLLALVSRSLMNVLLRCCAAMCVLPYVITDG